MDTRSGSVVGFLKDKSILITGSTGFLAKVFVEKVLRVQPEVKKLFLLVRATDAKSAAQRLHSEVTGKEVFRILREQHEKGFESFVSEKVSPVAGDIARENLGIDDSDLRDLLWREVDVVVNVAATTNFYERYDVALTINALGVKHVLDFAKKCEKLQLFLHVSTAYVAGTREGLLSEEGFHMGETLNGVTGLDIDAEVKLVEQSLKELRSEESAEKGEKVAMKELGIKRARFFGWPNTYVFTKALGEMLIGQSRGDVPVVIVRPTIITSTYKEPFPGWMEGTRTIDSLIIGYAKGKLTCFLGDLTRPMDLIPGDMVVNAMIVAMAAHANQRSEFIYHVSSSVSNPVTPATFQDCGYRYFSQNPPVDKDGQVMKTQNFYVFTTMASFRWYMTVRYWLPLQGLRLVNVALCGLLSQLYNELSRKHRFAMHLADLYEPYAFFKGRFDDLNLVRLRASSTAGDDDDVKMFNCDPKTIDWEHYFMKVHFPGVFKYAFK
uniref:Fatty acyl-CoA reductase n=1 Tax=Anthurium amnicola TaxID=1678845 RepID=A0A1D1XLR3_9ARAE